MSEINGNFFFPPKNLSGDGETWQCFTTRDKCSWAPKFFFRDYFFLITLIVTFSCDLIPVFPAGGKIHHTRGYRVLKCRGGSL